MICVPSTSEVAHYPAKSAISAILIKDISQQQKGFAGFLLQIQDIFANSKADCKPKDHFSFDFSCTA
jgi:hypothetical protein